MPPLDLIAPHMSFFDDPRAKELLITPHGLRLVYQADQAQRAHYLVLRQAAFTDLTLDPARLRDLMDRAIALYEDLKGTVHGQAQRTAEAA